LGLSVPVVDIRSIAFARTLPIPGERAIATPSPRFPSRRPLSGAALPALPCIRVIIPLVMSIAGSAAEGARTVFFQTELAMDGLAAGGVIPRPRSTPSVAPSLASRSGGRSLEAIFLAFPRMTQNALWRLCHERISIEAKLHAEDARLAAVSQSSLSREPDVLRRLRTAVKDNT
jgi:hypothetical protein